MKLPIDRIYVFPELSFSQKSREDLEHVLNKFFSYKNHNGDKLVNLLETLFDKETKAQALRMLDTIVLSETDLKTFKSM